MAIIYDCAITHTDCEVKQEYAYSLNKKEYHTGIDLYADTIYAPCKGVIIQSCMYESNLSIVLQYSEHISLRFSNLKEVFIKPGQLITTNMPLGLADKYVHFEYLTVEPTDLNYTIKIPPNYTLWKHDPRLILNKNIIFDESDFKNSMTLVWGDTLEELSNNRGDY